jgi:hypothetical protein
VRRHRREPGGSAAARLTLLALGVFAAPVATLEGQQGSSTGQWMGALLGAHVGIDYLFEGFVVGGQTIFLVDPWGRLALIPNAEIELRQGIRDWQANADAALMPLRGVYVGGGLAWRNTIFDEQAGRETRRGYSAFVGYRDPPAPGRVSPQIELRWSFIAGIRPRTLTLGANYPLLLFR